MKINVPMELSSFQAFQILLETLHVELHSNPPEFYLDNQGEIVCQDDDRGELYMALYHLYTKIIPNAEFRNIFEDPNKIMCQLYKLKEIEADEV